VQATVNSIHRELRSKPSSRGAQVWTAARRAEASTKSKERTAAKKTSAGGRKRGESGHVSEATLQTGFRNLLPNATKRAGKPERRVAKLFICRGLFGGPDRDRTDDLFHAMIWVMG
jgi:hypothetical protein